MQFDLISDLHLEFGQMPLTTSGNVLVVAGDVCDGNAIKPRNSQYESRFQDFFDLAAEKYKHVLYVLGNHDNYKLDIDSTVGKVLQIVKPNVRVLQNNHVIIDRVLYIGGTLWTDCNKRDPLSAMKVEGGMNDFLKIKKVVHGNYRKFRVSDMVYEHTITLNYFKNTLETLKKELHDFEKVVIISHHAPTLKSIPSYYTNNPINAAYASDLSEFILDNSIDVWVHGHIHEAVDYMVGDTRVVTNPRGYHGLERNTIHYTPLTVQL